MPPSQRPMVVGGYVHPQPGVCLWSHGPLPQGGCLYPKLPVLRIVVTGLGPALKVQCVSN